MSTAPLGSSDRKKCHLARDNYFSCTDKNEESTCRELKKHFEKSCPSSWVTYFVRKHRVEKSWMMISSRTLFCTVRTRAEILTSYDIVKQYENSPPKKGEKMPYTLSTPLERIFSLANLTIEDRLLSPSEISQLHAHSSLHNRTSFDASVLNAIRCSHSFLLFRSYLSHVFSMESKDVGPGVLLEAARTLSLLNMLEQLLPQDVAFAERLLTLIDAKQEDCPESISLPSRLLVLSCGDKWLQIIHWLTNADRPCLMLSLVADSVVSSAIKAEKLALIPDFINRCDRLLNRTFVFSLNPIAVKAFFRALNLRNIDHQNLLKWFLDRQNRCMNKLHEPEAKILADVMNKFGAGKITTIKTNGICRSCKEQLPISVSALNAEELSILTTAVFETLIKGHDIYNASSPEELNDFMNFLHTLNGDNQPSIVIDTLNLIYGYKVKLFSPTVTLAKSIIQLRQKFSKIVLIGRKNMRKWIRNIENDSNLSIFLCASLSLDDSYSLYTAMQTGAYLLTNDKFRAQLAQLTERNDHSVHLFDRWINRNVLTHRSNAMGSVHFKNVDYHDVLNHTGNGNWHVPFDTDPYDIHRQNWICLQSDTRNRR